MGNLFKFKIFFVLFLTFISSSYESSLSLKKAQEEFDGSSGELTVRGEYIRLSEISSSNLDRAKKILIFGTDTVVVDRSISRIGNMVDFVIMVPTIHVIGKSQLIDLSGSNGDNIWEKLGQQQKANDGRAGEPHGRNGAHGLPGGPGGDFVAICLSITGGTLNVISNGGRGGPGQDGGNGKRGLRGAAARMPESGKKIMDQLHGEIPYKETMTSIPNSGVLKDSRQNYDFFYYNDRRWYNNYNILVYGVNGGGGGSGGNGGACGVGGHSGKILIFSLGKIGNIFGTSRKGLEGNPGYGGVGGLGGDVGEPIYIYTVNPYYEPVVRWRDMATGIRKPGYLPLKIFQEKFANYQDESRRISRGSDGLVGSNNIPENAPKEKKKFHENLVLNDYKRFLRENIKEQNALFYNLIENSTEINKLYDMKGLINEIFILESQYPITNLSSIKYFEHYLKKISDSLLPQSPFRGSETTTGILKYLYMVVESKINMYKYNYNYNTNLIMDLSRFLKLSKEFIGNLKQFTSNLKDLEQIDVVKLNIETKRKEIENLQKVYTREIEEKIFEAENIVKLQLVPEVERFSDTELEEKIKVLVEETKRQQNETLDEIEKLKITKNNLESQRIWRSVLSAVKLTISVVSSIFPPATLATSVMSVGENFIFDDQTYTGKPILMPISVKNGIAATDLHLKRMQEQEIKKINTALEVLSSETAEFPQLYKQQMKIKELKATFDTRTTELRNNIDLSSETWAVDRKAYLDLNKELKVETLKLEAEFKKEKIEAKNEKKIKALKVIQNIEVIGYTALEVYSRHKNDQRLLDEIDSKIGQNEQIYKKFKEYEEMIYNDMIPMVKNIGNHLKRFESDLKGKSKASLHFERWNVKKMMKQLSLNLKLLIEGQKFAIQENLLHVVDKLQDSMATLVDIYDQIENLKRDKKLGDFLANIHLAGIDKQISINLNDHEVTKELSKLKIKIHSNIVRFYFTRALNSFKQWVFPFAYKYIGSMQAEIEQNVNMTTQDAISGIENLQIKLEEYKSTISKGQDEHIHIGQFNSEYRSTKPYYIWSNESYSDEISKLFSGKPVTFTADICKKDNFFKNTGYWALKFSQIGLNFKIDHRPGSNRSSRQVQMDSELNSFKIRMTHMGDSQYEFDDKIYSILSPIQRFTYNYEGRHVGQNLAAAKLHNGDVVLSPYTQWTIQLVNLTNSYEKISEFRNYVSIELVGNGTSVDPHTSVRQFDLNKHYRMSENQC